MKELQINTIYNEDCLETMRNMPDNYVDLIVTDPPYGISADNRKQILSRSKLAKAKDYGESDWDSKIPSKEVFDEILRVSKNQIIFGGNYFIEHLHNSPCWIVWDKNNGNNDFADAELARTSFKTAVRIKKHTWHGMIQEDMKNKDIREHPTQKPLAVMRWIVENYTKDTDLIYDPFMGSGTTARACKDLGRTYIGSEISKKYCDIAEKRLRQETLF